MRFKFVMISITKCPGHKCRLVGNNPTLAFTVALQRLNIIGYFSYYVLLTWRPLSINPREFSSTYVTTANTRHFFSLPALSSFYFHKQYTGKCSCSLCAVEKPGVLISHKDSYQNISGENHEIENHQEIGGLLLEKPQDDT